MSYMDVPVRWSVVGRGNLLGCSLAANLSYDHDLLHDDYYPPRTPSARKFSIPWKTQQHVCASPEAASQENERLNPFSWMQVCRGRFYLLNKKKRNARGRASTMWSWKHPSKSEKYR